MKDFKYLTTINAIYNSASMSKCEDGFNIFYTLEVLINDREDMLIKFNRCYVDPGKDPIVESGEKILKNIIGPLEFNFIKFNFKNNEKLIKELIFSKFLDYCNDELIFAFIY